MNTASLLETAIAEVDNLNPGETFKVKDLFVGYKWKRIPLNVRRSLGRNFFDPSMNPLLEDGTIEVANKTDSNQQTYVKIK